MFALQAAHPGKTVINNTAAKKFPNHFVNNRPPAAEGPAIPAGIDSLELIEILINELIKGRVGHAAGSVKTGRT